MVAASPIRLCSGLGGASTVYPWDWRRSITPLQLALFAHAPFTRTTVGLAEVAVPVRHFAWDCDVVRVIVRAAISASPIVSQKYVTRRSASRCMMMLLSVRCEGSIADGATGERTCLTALRG